MDLPPDFKDLLEELARSAVEFVLVGGYAVAFHGRPRATKDIDIFLGGSQQNLDRAADALSRFGAPQNVIASLRTMAESEIVYLVQPPMRVDFLRSIDGVEGAHVFADAVSATIDGIIVRFISLDHLITNKRSAGRPQDLIDAEYLEKIRLRSRP